jgi:hypothetical protein
MAVSLDVSRCRGPAKDFVFTLYLQRCWQNRMEYEDEMRADMGLESTQKRNVFITSLVSSGVHFSSDPPIVCSR